MSATKKAVELETMSVETKDLKGLGEVLNPQIFDLNNNFHPEGLFSTTIYGQVGSKYRSTMFGYMQLNCKILHPLAYQAIVGIKSFYKDVMEGKKTAIFDTKTKDLVPSSDSSSSTGYTFFISHIEKINLRSANPDSKSDARVQNINLVESSIKNNSLFIENLLVMPAGLRDYFVDQTGQPQEDEVNGLYRKVLNQSNLIDPNIAKKSPSSYDRLYVGLQNSVQELFEFLIGLLDGKHKLILGKWLSRKVFNTTRNVLSGYVEKGLTVNDPNRLGYNDCKIGLHQYFRTMAPKSIYELQNKYLKDIFIENNNIAYLTNLKTLKREQLSNSEILRDYDRWTSSDGIDSVMASLGNIDVRHKYITLNKGKHCLGLIYRDKKYFKFLQDIDSVPEGWDRSKVRPVTLAEFMYMSIYEMNGKYPGLVTRYPIQGFGGIYPCFVKLQTTIEFETLEELTPAWEPSGKIASSFPIKGKDFFNTITVHPSHLGKLGGDFDGDTVSIMGLMMDDVVEEIKDALNKRSYYISDTNELQFKAATEPLEAVLAYMN